MVIKLGFAGLGSASRRILASVEKTPGVQLAAVADVRSEALDAAAQKYPGVKTFDSVDALAACPDVDAVWLATPNQFHAVHAVTVAGHGKHVIGEKPMAITVAECDEIVDAARENHVKYVQGHSKLFGSAVRELGSVVASGQLGAVLQIMSWNSKPWLRQPRLAGELDIASGGGVVYRQGPHQLDIVRYFGGGEVTSVLGHVGTDPVLGADGDYSAMLTFANGAVATASFIGYGDFDGSELTWGIGEGGQKNADHREVMATRDGPVSMADKYAWADTRHISSDDDELLQPFFGLTIVTCERGVIRQSPEGIFVYRDEVRSEIRLPLPARDSGEIYELQRAIEDGDEPFPGAEWGRATVAVCVAIMDSSRLGAPLTPPAQTGLPSHVRLRSGEDRVLAAAD